MSVADSVLKSCNQCIRVIAPRGTEAKRPSEEMSDAMMFLKQPLVQYWTDFSRKQGTSPMFFARPSFEHGF